MRRGKGRATLRFTFRHGSIPLLANTDNSPRRASLQPIHRQVARGPANGGHISTDTQATNCRTGIALFTGFGYKVCPCFVGTCARGGGCRTVGLSDSSLHDLPSSHPRAVLITRLAPCTLDQEAAAN